MNIDDFTRYLTKEEERKLEEASRKTIFLYLLTKKRDKEENKILLSCILSYLLITTMIIIILISVISLSKENIIDEKMIKSFAIKTLIVFIITVILDLFFVGKKWYAYTNEIRNLVRKEINDRLKKY